MVVAIDWHRELLQVLRLPFWFACFWAVAGVAWRPPLASVVLLAIFLVLLVAVEWASRRLNSKKLLSGKTPKIEPDQRIDQAVQQRIIRSRTLEGQDRIDGTFWVEFPADTMTTTVHIPFCPAFEQIPKVQVFPADEGNIHLRIMPPKIFGVRVDVKRSNIETGRLYFTMIAEG